MSQENVEVVKRIFRGWDEEGVEGMLPFFHEDIEYRPVEEGGAVHGHDALRSSSTPKTPFSMASR